MQKLYTNVFDYLWQNPPAAFNQEFIPDHAKMSAEIRAIVGRGEPYASREERKAAYDSAYNVVRPKYKSLKELAGK